MAIIDELKYRFRSGSLLLKLIYVNVGVFVVFKLAMLLVMLCGGDPSVIASVVELPSSWVGLAHRPWTLLTYMLMHGDIFHIFFNMLCLYWVGIVFLEFNTPKQLVALYVLSGIGGALLYLLAYNNLPYFYGVNSMLVGASASVNGIMLAAAMRAPNYRVNLLFFGAVAMKWIVGVMILIDLLSMDGTNPGGHIAHIGGALVGVLYAVLLSKGFDITKGINRAIDSLDGVFENIANAFRGKKKAPKATSKKKYHYQSNTAEPRKRASVRSEFVSAEEEEVDAILEKIKVSGYASLTKEEKAKLFSVQNKKN